jgi:hypothetical protein
MHIEEWLHRLNLDSLHKYFSKQKIFRIHEIPNDEREFMEMMGMMSQKPIPQRHFKRLRNMIRGDKETHANFMYLSKHGFRSIATHYLDEKVIDELLHYVPDQSLTGFQLRDVLSFKTNIRSIRDEICKIVV